MEPYLSILAWAGQAILEHWLIVLLGAVGVAMLKWLAGLSERWPVTPGILRAALAGFGISVLFILILELATEFFNQQAVVNTRFTELMRQQKEAGDKQTKLLETLIGQRPTRPYFTHSLATLQARADGRYTLILDLHNHGAPARNIVMQTLVFDPTLDPTRPPLYRTRKDSANPTGASILSHHVERLHLNAAKRPIFVMFQIRYADVGTSKTHTQAIFLKSLGAAKNGTHRPDLVHATMDEKTRMERYVRDRGIPTL